MLSTFQPSERLCLTLLRPARWRAAPPTNRTPQAAERSWASIVARAFGSALAAAALVVQSGPIRAEDAWAAQRETLVEREVAGAGISHPGVLDALRKTPRHEFLPLSLRDRAYLDAALPIGDEQTISPPFVVAYMTEQLDPQPTDRVLEIGTGSGYQAAVLSPLVAEVATIEIVPRLGRRAERTLKRLGYGNVHVRIGDGYQGWPEKAPFDKILVTCSPEKIPQPLVDQLREGGRMIIPVGERYRQNLYRVVKRNGRLEQESLQATLFVPMTGNAEKERQKRPDPRRPALFNGGFERAVGDGDQPEGWHYIRQARLVGEGSARQGKWALRFENLEPSRPSHALQGFAVDGRAIAKLTISLWARGEGLKAGGLAEEQAGLIVTFYDERRAAVDHVRLGPWIESFAWRRESIDAPVPLAAREAIVRIGLHGGVGRLDVDEMALGPAVK